MKWKDQRVRVKNLAKNEIKPNMALFEREFLIVGLRKLGLWLREGANFSLILSFILSYI